ncbi:MAG TPA: chemotaxis protein CheW [Bacteroidota bacterium]|nr:chemotaxis protein CheW [Bacteroidota bacterium]
MSTPISETSQYLTFKLGEEIYATDIAQVREVLEYTRVTKVPRTPEYMRGVINLRGHVVPVLDLKLRFGMERTEQTVNTCIIIVDIRMDDEQTVIGALADSVQEVIEMDAASIRPAPRIGTRLNTNFIRGMGKRDEEFVIILDIEEVFSGEELEALDTAIADQQETEASA